MDQELPFLVGEDDWRRLVEAARFDSGVLGDGAEVEAVDLPDSPADTRAITFYATREHAPDGWPYPFLEEDCHGRRRTFIGDAQREPDGHVVLEVYLKEAVEQLLADYRGGTLDVDEAALDSRADEVAAGREEDRKWLAQEFERLMAACHVTPAGSF